VSSVHNLPTLRPVGAAGPVTGAVVLWRDGRSWDRFVRGSADSTAAHRWAWTTIVPRAYGHQVFPVAAVRGQRLLAVLPLVLVRGALFGRHLVSMPYLDTGGVCGSDAWAQEALVAGALEMADAYGAHLELRHLTDRGIDLPPSLHKVTMEVPLDGGTASLWERVKSNRRGQVRKARRQGLTASIVGAEGIDDFYRIMARNMRDLGSPMHRRHFFAAIVDEFGDDARIILVRSGQQALAAGLMLFHGSRALLPFSSCLRAARPSGANQLLYWSVLEYAVSRGCAVADLGRSSVGSGTYEAKREWGARDVQLYWYRNPPATTQGLDTNESRLLRLAVRAWEHAPVWAATKLGAAIRGGLPQ
jgi:serine/alanine adding enzyme